MGDKNFLICTGGPPSSSVHACMHAQTERPGANRAKTDLIRSYTCITCSPGRTVYRGHQHIISIDILLKPAAAVPSVPARGAARPPVHDDRSARKQVEILQARGHLICHLHAEYTFMHDMVTLKTTSTGLLRRAFELQYWCFYLNTGST
jgi:hypothetical protein